MTNIVKRTIMAAIRIRPKAKSETEEKRMKKLLAIAVALTLLCAAAGAGASESQSKGRSRRWHRGIGAAGDAGGEHGGASADVVERAGYAVPAARW